MEKNQQNEKQMEEIAQMKRDYIAAFSTESGKRVLENLEKVCYINNTTYTKNGDALGMAMHEGMRFVVVHIKNLINFDLEKLKSLTQKGE